MDTAKAVMAVVGGIIVVAILSVAVWQLGWFVEEKNVDRRTQVDNNSIGRQQALTDAVLRNVTVIRDIDTQEQTPAVIAQRKAIVSATCSDYAKLTGSVTLDPSTESFLAQECN